MRNIRVADRRDWVVNERPAITPKAGKTPKRQRRLTDVLATLPILLLVPAIALMAIPASASSSGRSLLTKWSSDFRTSTIQETSGQLEYEGTWIRADHEAYFGDHARFSDERGATVKLSFRGSAVSWIGPVGPTRGKAWVYIDGKRVSTVDTYAASFEPARVLFKMTWANVGRHRIAIKVLGTAGHPTVAIDAIVVRGAPTDERFEAPVQTEAPDATPTPSPTPSPDSGPGTTTAPAVTPAPTPTAAPTAAPAPTPAPTAAPTPTPAPTAAPTPAPTAAPTPAPASGGSTFGSRPARAPIVISGGSNVTISNVSIDGGSVNSPQGIGITIRNVTGTITIRDVDLSDLVGGIYISQSSGTLIIENVRSRNIGDGTIGAGHSNHIQLAESSFSGAIRDNLFLGGRTEDMVSTWHSGGRGSGQELVIEGNRFQGLVSDTSTARAWTSGSGTGLILSDGAGSSKNGWIIVRNNTFLTPGQVGIQHIDGPGLQVYGNVVYGEKRAKNNNPMTSWEGNPRGTVRDNRYCWTNENGSQPAPWFTEYGSLTVTSNVKDCSINPATLRVTLP